MLRVQRDPQTLKGQGLPHSFQLPEGRRPSREPGNTAGTPGQEALECREEWQAGESKVLQRVTGFRTQTKNVPPHPFHTLIQ